MMTNDTIFRVWKTHQLAGSPAELPVKDFEGGLDDFCRKYKRGAEFDDLRPFSNDDFSTSFTVECKSGDNWVVCDDPRPSA